MKTRQRKAYETPELKVYGKVTDLTRQSNLQNSDVPQGTPGTAYPALPPGS